MKTSAKPRPVGKGLHFWRQRTIDWAKMMTGAMLFFCGVYLASLGQWGGCLC